MTGTPKQILRKLALDWRFTFGFVVLASAAFRLAVWSDFLRTPLDMYTKIETLDMKFLLSQAEGFLHLGGALTMHRLLCAISSLFTGGVLTTHGIVMAQMALGVLTAALVCLAAMRISGSRIAGLVAGLFTGCYAPALMYECFVMKESVTLFFSALTLWSFVAARHGILSLAGHGFAAAALPLARPAGLLWAIVSTGLLSLRNFKRGYVRAATPAIALLLGLLGAFAFNCVFAGSARFFDTNASYNFQVGAIPDAKSYNVTDSSVEGLSKTALLMKVISNAPSKVLALLNAYQAPDNVNYYFIKDALPCLSMALGPLLLISLGLAGLLIGLCMAWRRRALRLTAPLAHFVFMAIPICAFIVTGRYALFLVPSLAVGAGLFVHLFAGSLRGISRERGLVAPASMAVLYGLVLWQAIPRDAWLRADDFIAYGLASNMKYGLCQQEGECYAKALEVNPDSVGAAVNLGKWLMDMRQVAEAVSLLGPFRERHPNHFGLLVNHSLALIMSGHQAEAEQELLAYGEPNDVVAKAKWCALLQLSKGVAPDKESK